MTSSGVGTISSAGISFESFFGKSKKAAVAPADEEEAVDQTKDSPPAPETVGPSSGEAKTLTQDEYADYLKWKAQSTSPKPETEAAP